ncbi:hypothetical protein [Guptibacillus hwajinpoensis]|uniref:hypothetical protein n=1 Tax=Guptibacillus hwajinpoensis TaxID=208199 RepID=UPI003D0820E1
MRETDYVDGTVDGNIIRYSWEENTSSGDEVEGPSYGDCGVKQDVCPTDFGLGEPELGKTGLEITWTGFVVSLSETVVAAILDVTAGTPTEAAFIAALNFCYYSNKLCCRKY